MKNFLEKNIMEDSDKSRSEFDAKINVIHGALLDALDFLVEEEERKEPWFEQSVRDTVGYIRHDLTGKEKDFIGALVIIESGQRALDKKIEKLAEAKEEAGPEESIKISEDIEQLNLRKQHYAEAEDFLFSYSDFCEDIPSRSEVDQWLEKSKKDIEWGAENEPHEGSRKVFESKMRSLIPALNRLFAGKQVGGDYDLFLEEMSDKIDGYRDSISDDLANEFRNPGSEVRKNVLENLKKIYELRSFSAMLEGERNERIALKK